VTALLAVHLAATWYMTGVIWIIQMVHYPLMGKLGATFVECQSLHQTRMGSLVGPPMLIELGAAALLCWLQPREPVWWIGIALLTGIWLSTFLVQVPKHNRLACAFEPREHASLVTTNWLRTVLWTLRALIAVWATVK
jgi:hypothetical protein